MADETDITDKKGVSIHFDMFLNVSFSIFAFLMGVTLALRKKCGKNGKEKAMNVMFF